MSTSRVQQLLESRLLTWAKARAPKLSVAVQDSKFSPKDGETYLRCFVLPATTGSDTVDGAHRRYTGVWQVSIVKPSGGGLQVARQIEDELGALFPNNLKLSLPGFDLFIRSPMSAGSVITDDLNTTIPVSCRYRADT